MDDKKSVLDMTDNRWRLLCRNKRYISGFLEGTLDGERVNFITNTRNNMKPKVMNLWDRLILRK
ncbi:hypothetical protein BTN49_2898 [Candidatus Enterovibrio escicola]|uniref:Transposase DDE domain-containing protein n=1 Tax=Candidatus Enterovibrio escicola TaxID=1927127 RepID=A0A2A5SZL0_9GAMM|nr:hypothetical protein BTN49_2898 [Candidatus Enterovibrio escacola]